MSAFFHVDLTCLVLRVFLGPQNVDNVESTFFLSLGRFVNPHKKQAIKQRKMEELHIGKLIREELRRQGKTNRWLAEGINVNMRTVNKIFLKRVIDTQRLM